MEYNFSDILSISLAAIFICFMATILSAFFIHKIPPNTTVDGCRGDNCKAPRCVGHDCQCNPCIGNQCTAGYCVGTNCKAGDCTGINCKAGDCYGDNCKPGICRDPNCPPESCPQLNKQCIDGTVNAIPNNFYLQNRRYFPRGTLMNPPV